MKMVIAIISPTKVNTVREALVKIEVERMTVCDAQQFLDDCDQLPSAFFHGISPSKIQRRIVLEVVVNDDFLERTISAIQHALEHATGPLEGERNIFVIPIEQAIQLGETARGPMAV